ncbi:hypothetical protein V5P93_001933 [Actinokineospora auranticolor]|uniref:Camelysin-like metallo-endopeptidase n=1 Tax=Actinokineospora auranticolor TaxID=155976 RepID=A0A2S6GBJ7_9PSEU|nr:hypothetical protein [Actinokineospora auranticolor]PPK60907.1 hypothetical protein CLV40_1463 [Actinokineospora auranticolor]
MGHYKRSRVALTTAVSAVTAAVALVAGATPALALTSAGLANAGSASYNSGGPVTIAPIAQCRVEGPTSASSNLISANGVRFGAAQSKCTTTVIDPQQSLTRTKSETNGSSFELSALVLLGGPRVKIGAYRATCTADNDGTTAGWSFANISGVGTLPNPLPNDYVVQLKSLVGVSLATITFNEVDFPEPNDGSITLNIAHIRFLPASGITGEVVVGSTACSPTP